MTTIDEALAGTGPEPVADGTVEGMRHHHVWTLLWGTFGPFWKGPAAHYHQCMNDCGAQLVGHGKACKGATAREGKPPVLGGTHHHLRRFHDAPTPPTDGAA